MKRENGWKTIKKTRKIKNQLTKNYCLIVQFWPISLFLVSIITYGTKKWIFHDQVRALKSAALKHTSEFPFNVLTCLLGKEVVNSKAGRKQNKVKVKNSPHTTGLRRSHTHTKRDILVCHGRRTLRPDGLMAARNRICRLVGSDFSSNIWKWCLRRDAARNLNICCTLFLWVCFMFVEEFLMYTEPYETSIGLVGVKTVYGTIHWKQQFWHFTK